MRVWEHGSFRATLPSGPHPFRKPAAEVEGTGRSKDKGTGRSSCNWGPLAWRISRLKGLQS